MKSINLYIIEKLHIDKDTQVYDKSKPTNWEVGDIIVGIDSGNTVWINFYKIVKVLGKSFDVRQLKEKIVKGDGQRGESVPELDKYESNEIKRIRINKFGSAKIGYEYCYIWSGNPVAFDHMD